MVRVRKGQRPLSSTQRCQGTNLQWTPFSFLLRSKSFLLYNIVDANANSHGHTSSSPPLTRCTPSYSMSPTQFTWYFRREHQRPVYFRYYVHFLLDQGPNSVPTSMDVKGIFRSILPKDSSESIRRSEWIWQSDRVDDWHRMCLSERECINTDSQKASISQIEEFSWYQKWSTTNI